MLELHLHGGVSVTTSVLEALGSLPDFRMSYKGEFTRRSYENNKMTLLEVEALADLVNADTDEQRVLALKQLNGKGAEVIQAWRQTLVSVRSQCEAVLDFGEEESDVVESGVLSSMVQQIENLHDGINEHLNNQSHEIIRDGARVTVLGPTNAGKSSLLNCLINQEVSIVTDIPGTTRDIIERSMDISGLPFTLSDSAGIRNQVSDPVEQIGIGMAKDSARNADIRVFVLDIGAFLEQSSNHGSVTDVLDTLEHLNDEDIFPDIIVVNKADLIKANSSVFGIETTISTTCDKEKHQDVSSLVRNFFLHHGVPRIENVPIVVLSCHSGIGVNDLKGLLVNFITPSTSKRPESNFGKESLVVSRARQKKRLIETFDCLSNALRQLGSVKEGYGQLELVAEELRMASTALEKLTGTVHVEDVLDALFKEFCIGK